MYFGRMNLEFADYYRPFVDYYYRPFVDYGEGSPIFIPSKHTKQSYANQNRKAKKRKKTITE